MRRSLTRDEILRTRRDLRRVFASRTVYRTNGLHLRVAEPAADRTRALFATPRGYRTAVARNRARRHLREAFRQHRHLLSSHHDLAFVIYPGDFSYADRVGQMKQLLARAGLVAAL